MSSAAKTTPLALGRWARGAWSCAVEHHRPCDRRAGAVGPDGVSHSVEYGGHQARTLYDGVQQVPPGHYLIATDCVLQERFALSA